MSWGAGVRYLLRLDRPDQHLTRAQFVLAVAVALSSAALWGSVSGRPVMWLAILAIQLYPAWATPAARERLLMRILWSHVIGAAAAGTAIWSRQFMS